MNMEKSPVTVQTSIAAPMDQVWSVWTSPDHIVKWNNASDDWHTPKAENDLRVGGTFTYRMEAKDGSVGFAFSGIYEEVAPNARIVYRLEDNRKVLVTFEEDGSQVKVKEIFDPEEMNSIELQQAGWQAILDNFKKYTESIQRT